MAIKNVSQRTLPGPTVVPLVGSWATMLKFFYDPCTYSRWLHGNYGEVVAMKRGDPAYVFAFGPAFNFHLLSQPALFEVGKGTILKVPKDTAWGRIQFYNLLNMNGEHHKRHRHLMQPAFHKRQIELYHADMAALTLRMLDRWQSVSQIELHAEMKKLTQRITVKTLFGLDDEEEIDRIGALFQKLGASQLLLMFTPLIDMPGMPYHRTLRLAERLESFIRVMIAKKREDAEATDVLAALVHAHDEDGTRLTDDELISHTVTLYAAGHVTTSNALAWAIFLIHQHPRIHADLLAELDSTLHGEAPTLESLRQLSLLDGAIKESLRLLPPAPTSMRIAAEPCEVGGFALPKGSTIFYSPFITHRLPELYEEPDRFKPERWATLSRTSYEYLPFAAGPHRCIGAEFALQEMKVVLAMLLQRYRLAIVPNTRVEPKGSNLDPAYGMPMRIIPQDRRFERVPVRGSIHRLIEFV
ncbi:MAG: cytochrome P450 [Ktedonobacteraceae bacterium]|nr:cytochrome P450 [Ktedonobacteraceae bacterium]MBO0790409.1 cytochrome P450 [Ktedonobacteraceae bacterium]